MSVLLCWMYKNKYKHNVKSLTVFVIAFICNTFYTNNVYVCVLYHNIKVAVPITLHGKGTKVSIRETNIILIFIRVLLCLRTIIISYISFKHPWY